MYSSSGQTNGPFAGYSAAEPRQPSSPNAGSVAEAGSAPSGTKYSASNAVIRIATDFGIPRLVMDRTIRWHLS